MSPIVCELVLNPDMPVPFTQVPSTCRRKSRRPGPLCVFRGEDLLPARPGSQVRRHPAGIGKPGV